MRKSRPEREISEVCVEVAGSTGPIAAVGGAGPLGVADACGLVLLRTEERGEGRRAEGKEEGQSGAEEGERVEARGARTWRW